MTLRPGQEYRGRRKVVVSSSSSRNQDRCSCRIKVNGRPFRALIDSGADVSLVHAFVYKQMGGIPR